MEEWKIRLSWSPDVEGVDQDYRRREECGGREAVLYDALVMVDGEEGRGRIEQSHNRHHTLTPRPLDIALFLEVMVRDMLVW